MQPDDNEPMISGQPQSIMIDPMTGLPQNVIIIQEPSAGPKVVGILVIIWGVISILGEVFSIGQTLSMGSIFIASSVHWYCTGPSSSNQCWRQRLCGPSNEGSYGRLPWWSSPACQLHQEDASTVPRPDASD